MLTFDWQKRVDNDEDDDARGEDNKPCLFLCSFAPLIRLTWDVVFRRADATIEESPRGCFLCLQQWYCRIPTRVFAVLRGQRNNAISVVIIHFVRPQNWREEGGIKISFFFSFFLLFSYQQVLCIQNCQCQKCRQYAGATTTNHACFALA